MEVDPPTSSSSPVQNGSNLKRSNSAPMINMLVTTQAETESETSNPQSSFKPANAIALRRLSSSNMMLQNMPVASTSPPIRGPDRVTRLKQEEIHIADREKRHEKEIQSSLWISSNWDNLTLDCSEPMESHHRRPRSFSESLHIMTQSNILCGSPSPTRGSIKQCFSPSMQIAVKNMTFTPSPSPSPTRKNFMRSLSPIAMRSGSLKRKLDNDGGDRWDYLSPPKKFHTGPLTPDRLMTQPHPLAHSISSSSLEEANSSPEQHLISRCSGGSSGGSSSSSSTSSLSIHPYPHNTHHLLPGMRSPHHTLGQQSPLSSSGAPSPLSSSGHGSMSSGCSSVGSSIGGNNNGVTGSSGNGSNNNGASGSSAFPAVLTSKQGFLFRPVSETPMGSSPSSSTSCSSSSLSSLSLPPAPMQHHQQMHHHHQQSPLLSHHQQQQQQQHHSMSSSSSSTSSSSSSSISLPSSHQFTMNLSRNPTAAAAVLAGMESSTNNTNNNNGSTSDICMSDSEMGDIHSHNGNNSNTKSVIMEDQQEVSYNFKPISPDHHG